MRPTTLPPSPYRGTPRLTVRYPVQCPSTLRVRPRLPAGLTWRSRGRALDFVATRPRPAVWPRGQNRHRQPPRTDESHPRNASRFLGLAKPRAISPRISGRGSILRSAISTSRTPNSYAFTAHHGHGVVGAQAVHSAGKESSVSSTIRKTVGKSGMNTMRHASKAV